MNRNEEYMDLMNELDEKAPSMEWSIAKAKKRKLRKQMLWRPMATVAVMCAMFVLLVNVSAPVAQAVSKVPLIGELAEKLKFSKSLSDAVENEYIQTINQKQTANGITAEVVYMIADVKQANILYRVTSDIDKELRVDASVENRMSKGGGGNIGKSDGVLYRYSVNFSENIPEGIEFRLEVYGNESERFSETESIAVFDFVLEVDKELMGEAKIYNIGKTIEMDGQIVTVKAVEVYPTHTRLIVIPERANTAILNGMNFYINTDKGTKFERVKAGTTLYASNEEYAFFGDSIYFYDEELVEVVITDVEWVIKDDYRRPVVNLVTGECYYLSDEIELMSVEREGNKCTVSFKAKYGECWSDYSIFSNSLTCNGCSDRFDEIVITDCGDGYFIETLTIYDWPYDEFMLQPNMEYTWTPTEEIVIPLQ